MTSNPELQSAIAAYAQLSLQLIPLLRLESEARERLVSLAAQAQGSGGGVPIEPSATLPTPEAQTLVNPAGAK